MVAEVDRLNQFMQIDPELPFDAQINSALGLIGPQLSVSPYGKSQFETQSPIGEANRLALTDWMLSLPEPLGNELFREGGNLNEISDNATNHKALERMYVGPDTNLEPSPIHHEWSRLFIENIHNSMAVRNRLRIVESEFTRSMRQALEADDREIKVLSIAAGSSRGIFQGTQVINGEGETRIKLRMVDYSREALHDGANLASDMKIKESVDFIRSHFLSFKRYLTGLQPSFVEIVGLMDYLTDDQVVTLLSQVREEMPKGGKVLYSNVTENDERDFTHKIVGWGDMYYRSALDLDELALNANFELANITRLVEPLGVYNLVLAEK